VHTCLLLSIPVNFIFVYPFSEPELECARNMDRSINAQDIMFVMGESQVCPSACEPCQNDLEAEEGDERLRLDLERYRSQGGGIKPYNMMTDNASGIPACCELKVTKNTLFS